MKVDQVLGNVCPKCSTLNSLSDKKCRNCGYPLGEKQFSLKEIKISHRLSHTFIWAWGIILILLVGSAMLYGFWKNSFRPVGAGTYRIVYENQAHQVVRKTYLTAWRTNGSPVSERRFIVFPSKSAANQVSIKNLEKYARKNPQKCGDWTHADTKQGWPLTGTLRFHDHEEIFTNQGNNRGRVRVSNDPAIKYYRYDLY